jgi:hypothetical protein
MSQPTFPDDALPPEVFIGSHRQLAERDIAIISSLTTTGTARG